MHLKTWFIFQMEKHCFQRPLLGSLPVPLTSLSKKIGLSCGVGRRNLLGSPFSGRFWNQRLLALPRQGRVIGSHFMLCVTVLSLPRGEPWAPGCRERIRATGGGHPSHTWSKSQTQGTAGLWPHIGQMPSGGRDHGPGLWLSFKNPCTNPKVVLMPLWVGRSSDNYQMCILGMRVVLNGLFLRSRRLRKFFVLFFLPPLTA